MKSIEDALAEYIDTLATSAAHCHHANDRPLYDKHLAAAAIMFASFRRTGSTTVLKEYVAQERRAYGRSFLSGPEGEGAESAFDRFAKLVESL